MTEKYIPLEAGDRKNFVTIEKESLNKIDNNLTPAVRDYLPEDFSNPLNIQIGGNHYKNFKIQPIEYAMANNLNACQANIIKYVTRYKEKNGIEDLKKAKHYIDLIIQLEYNENVKEIQ